MAWELVKETNWQKAIMNRKRSKCNPLWSIKKQNSCFQEDCCKIKGFNNSDEPCTPFGTIEKPSIVIIARFLTSQIKGKSRDLDSGTRELQGKVGPQLTRIERGQLGLSRACFANGRHTSLLMNWQPLSKEGNWGNCSAFYQELGVSTWMVPGIQAPDLICFWFICEFSHQTWRDLPGLFYSDLSAD